MNAAKEFVFGFALAIVIAAGIVLLLTLTIFGFETPRDISRAIIIALAATAFILVYAGGEIAFSFLFAWDRPIGVKVMHFLGAVCAIVGAYFTFPLLLNGLASSQEKNCRTVVQAELGPLSISREVCDE